MDLDAVRVKVSESTAAISPSANTKLVMAAGINSHSTAHFKKHGGQSMATLGRDFHYVIEAGRNKVVVVHESTSEVHGCGFKSFPMH